MTNFSWLNQDWLPPPPKEKKPSPISADGSTLTDLQPSCSLSRSLIAAPLPPLLEPPVSRTHPGLTDTEAIPSPSTQTGVVRTLRAVVLQEGPTDGTGDSKATTQCQHAYRTSHFKCLLVSSRGVESESYLELEGVKPVASKSLVMQ